MAIALALADSLGVTPSLPACLLDMAECVRQVERIEHELLPTVVGGDFVRALDQSFDRWVQNPDSELGLASPVERKNILLRLWSGCVSAGKTIAFETRSGPNTPEDRARNFNEFIDPRAVDDPVFRKGVTCAIAWKVGRGQGYSLDGVPSGSAVREGDIQVSVGRG